MSGFTLSVRTDTVPLSKKLEAFLTGSMNALRTEVRQEAREILRLIDGAAAPSSEEKGRNAVERDLHRTFSPVSPGFYQHVAQLSQGSLPTQIFQRRKNGTVYAVEWSFMGSDQSTLAAFHASRRVNGVVPAHPFSFDRNDWKEDRRMVVPQDAFDRYLQTVEARVGIERSGWIPALRELHLPIPAFVSRHGPSRGTYQDHTSDPINPRISFGNKVESAQKRLQPSTRRGRMQNSVHDSLQKVARQSGL